MKALKYCVAFLFFAACAATPLGFTITVVGESFT